MMIRLAGFKSKSEAGTTHVLRHLFDFCMKFPNVSRPSRLTHLDGHHPLEGL